MQIKNADTTFGHQRIVIEEVSPQIDCGRFAVKRCLNDVVTVEAKIFADGHDELAAVLKYRTERSSDWQTTAFISLGNDLWQAKFTVSELGNYYFTIEAWVDYFHSWRRNLIRWHESQQDISMELQIGANLIKDAIRRAKNEDLKRLLFFVGQITNTNNKEVSLKHALDEELFKLMAKYPDLDNLAYYNKELPVTVDREKARFSSWYELFPRSLGRNQQHGTFKDLIEHLPYIAKMGFDVLYLPPIHPIGHTYRKGKNNNPQAQPNDPGSPWGIGANEGGHSAIHPQLGNLEDFKELVRKAQEQGLEIALDLAIQCSPDHPFVKKNSQWFKKRPDDSIQYAENPPKKYQDIYPVYFQTEQWQKLWETLKQTVLFWIKQGVNIFRVDNPHTKSFIFWEWLIYEIKHEYPQIIFLAEAFTRPSVMYYLAKLGFSQSYTYFTWRTGKAEITDYLTELTQSKLREYFRPNFWPNTPDILHELLQVGGRPAFISRLVLAATLTANYGIYGPAFELCVNTPREPGSEEYLDSEKYEIKTWDLNLAHNLSDIIRRVNIGRRDNVCLHDNISLNFHHIENEQLICYSKCNADKTNVILVVVNLDPHHTQSGWLNFPMQEFRIGEHDTYCLNDLLSDNRYLWQGPRNYIELNPEKIPAHVFLISRVVPHEQDFDEFQ